MTCEIAIMNLSSESQHYHMATVGYTPFGNTLGNAYTERCIHALGNTYEVVPIPRTRLIICGFFSKKVRRLDFAITNWEDLWIVSGHNGRLSFFGIASFIIRLLALRLVARNVIYVRHDRFPHHTVASHSRLAQLILDLSEHLANIVVTHSPGEARAHRKYVPHPLYHSPLYKGAIDNGRSAKPYFIVFGRLLPYKGIEALIMAFPEDQNLLVVGPCDDAAYHDQLRALCSGKRNIEVRAQYIDEQMADELVRNAKAMLLTSTGADMVVSGSYFFALSNATPVIAMESDFYRWSVDINHAPGLTVCKTTDEMVCEITQFASPDRQEIADYAITNFGEDAVRRTWAEVLTHKQRG